MSERQIDDAIDAAVRDLMNVDADPAFRARVVDRLHRPKPRAGWWRQLSVAAAALVVIIAVVLMRDDKKPADGHPVAAATMPLAAPPRTPAPAETRRPSVAAGTAATPAAPPLRPVRRTGATTHAIERGAIVATVADVDDAGTGDSVIAGTFPSREPITSIELAPISHAPIVAPEVVITPLAAPSAIVIAPLDPRKERN